MQQVIVESALGNELAQISGQVIVCDADGHALGFFSPLKDRPRVNELDLAPPWSIAESEKRRKSKSGKPLEEILNRLGLQ